MLPCRLKQHEIGDRQMKIHEDIGLIGKMPTIPYMKQFDVIAGHLPHGFFPSVYTHDNAIVSGINTRVLVTWLRHPLSMVISSAIYLMSKQGKRSIVNITPQEVIDKILTKLHHKVNTIPIASFNTIPIAVTNTNIYPSSPPIKPYSQFIKYLLPGGLKMAATLSHQQILKEIRNTLEEYSVIGRCVYVVCILCILCVYVFIFDN